MESSSQSAGTPPLPTTPVYGPTNPKQPDDSVQRYASVIELIPEKEALYRKLHAEVWPDVVRAIKTANINNYSIFVASIKGCRYLFSYFEYTGQDAEADFASIAADPTTRNEWWPLTDACQRILEGTPDSQQWLPLESVMHIP